VWPIKVNREPAGAQDLQRLLVPRERDGVFDGMNDARYERISWFNVARLRSRRTDSDVLQNEVQIPELVPEIFSGNRLLVGRANLFGWEKCTK
jgi:hypothetical protein